MDLKGILHTIKEASPFDIFLISFIALPFVFEAWLRILEKLEASSHAKYWSLVVILISYILGIISMLIGANRSKKREIAKDQIINYLSLKEWEMMRLSSIRKNINSSYSDEFLNSLPIHFPNQIRRAKLDGNEPGLARIIESDDDLS